MASSSHAGRGQLPTTVTGYCNRPLTFKIPQSSRKRSRLPQFNTKSSAILKRLRHRRSTHSFREQLFKRFHIGVGVNVDDGSHLSQPGISCGLESEIYQDVLRASLQ